MSMLPPDFGGERFQFMEETGRKYHRRTGAIRETCSPDERRLILRTKKKHGNGIRPYQRLIGSVDWRAESLPIYSFPCSECNAVCRHCYTCAACIRRIRNCAGGTCCDPFEYYSSKRKRSVKSKVFRISGRPFAFLCNFL